jgi:hypothetical protein
VTSATRRSNCWRRTARGLTHLRVDRHAGFAEGTTSFYYQTRAALFRGAIERVIELDIADFTGALDATGDGEVDSLLSTLATQAMRTAVEPERSRARARFELDVFLGLMDQFVAISEAAVAQVQPARTPQAGGGDCRLVSGPWTCGPAPRWTFTH